MEEVTRLEHLSLVSKICVELKNHLGLNDKDLAEFIIHLAEKNGTFAAFKKVLIENGTEFSDSFMANLLRIIQHMKPTKTSVERLSKSSSKQDELALKFPALALPNEGPRAEVKDEDIVNDVMASLETFAPSNKKQSTNAEASNDKINERNGERKSKSRRKSRSRSRDRIRHRSQRFKTCSRSRTRHRSRDQGCRRSSSGSQKHKGSPSRDRKEGLHPSKFDAVRAQLILSLENSIEKILSAERERDKIYLGKVANIANGRILCSKHLPDEMLMEIFSYVDWKTLLSCQLVCKHWLILIVETKIWSKKILPQKKRVITEWCLDVQDMYYLFGEYF